MTILNHHTGRGSLLRALPVLAILVVACDKDGDVGPPPDPQPRSVRIEGPTQVTSPAQVQFKAFQTWSDGSNRDVTAVAQWTSTNPSVLSISAGSATASAPGEIGLTARFEAFTSQTVTVRVLPTTPEWNGTYTLTVGSGTCGGSIPLPPELRQRTYTAFIQQTSLTLTGTISNVGFFGGQIFNPQVRFFLPGAGTFARPARKASVNEVLPGGIRLAVSRYEPRFYLARYSEPPQPLAEVLPDGNRLVITGQAVTTMSPSGFAGTLNGALALYEPSRNNLLAVCSSSSHGFTLVRQ